MARKDDTDKLMARENRRRASLVGSIAGVEPVEAPEAVETSPVVVEAMPVVVAPVAQPVPAASDAPLIRSVTKPVRKEARTSRRQVVLTPSLSRAIDRKLKAGGLSFNEVVHQLLQNWVDAE